MNRSQRRNRMTLRAAIAAALLAMAHAVAAQELTHQPIDVPAYSAPHYRAPTPIECTPLTCAEFLRADPIDGSLVFAGPATIDFAGPAEVHGPVTPAAFVRVYVNGQPMLLQLFVEVK